MRRFGKAEADKRQAKLNEKRSSLVSGEKNPMYGRSDQCYGIVSFMHSAYGKSYEEIWGEEAATKRRKDASNRMSGDKNPAFGKVYSNGGKSVKGYYKGFFFRSLLEYSFMKYQESLGREIGKDFRPYEVSIPYEVDGIKRTYHPDFIVEPDNCIVEIKQSYAINQKKNLVKFKAGKQFAEASGKSYQVLTELDFPKILFDEAINDVEVVWDKETFKFFKKGRGK